MNLKKAPSNLLQVMKVVEEEYTSKNLNSGTNSDALSRFTSRVTYLSIDLIMCSFSGLCMKTTLILFKVARIYPVAYYSEVHIY